MTGWIDSHHHLWDLNAVHYPWLMAKGVRRFFGDPASIQRDYPLAEFRADAAAQGITGSVHIQVGAEDRLDEARWVDAQAAANPDWPLVQVAFADLTAEDIEAELAPLDALPTMRGVRQIVGRAPAEDAKLGTYALLQHPRFIAGLRAAAARGWSYDLQLIPEVMIRTAEVLEQLPELDVALCHCGSPHDKSAAGLAIWASGMRRLAENPRVVCKLSGLGMFDHDWTTESIRPFVDHIMEVFGPNRVMFGSNFPVDGIYTSYARLVDGFRQTVPVAHHAAVFGKTAARFYRF